MRKIGAFEILARDVTIDIVRGSLRGNGAKKASAARETTATRSPPERRFSGFGPSAFARKRRSGSGMTEGGASRPGNDARRWASACFEAICVAGRHSDPRYLVSRRPPEPRRLGGAAVVLVEPSPVLRLQVPGASCQRVRFFSAGLSQRQGFSSRRSAKAARRWVFDVLRTTERALGR